MSDITAYRDFADIIDPGPTTDIRWRVGVIESTINLTDNTATVRLGNSPLALSGIRCVAPYKPLTGDVVLVLKYGPSLWIIGKINGGIEIPLHILGGTGNTYFSIGGYTSGVSKPVLLGGTTVQDVDGFGNIRIGLGTAVTAILSAWAVGGDANSLDPLNCNLFDSDTGGFSVSLSDHNGIIGDIGLVRLNWGAICWV